jgi:excisionase family DNA binding protein
VPNDLLSVTDVAQLLGLHVKTVRAYVRDGRLKAVRIGKSYRIARADLDRLTGMPAPPVRRTRHVETSSIVDIDAIDQDASDRLTNALVATAKAHPYDEGKLRFDTMYDEERAHLKVVLTGTPRTVATLLQLVAALADRQ